MCQVISAGFKKFKMIRPTLKTDIDSKFNNIDEKTPLKYIGQLLIDIILDLDAVTCLSEKEKSEVVNFYTKINPVDQRHLKNKAYARLSANCKETLKALKDYLLELQERHLKFAKLQPEPELGPVEASVIPLREQIKAILRRIEDLDEEIDAEQDPVRKKDLIQIQEALESSLT
jgi:hypothetical protein